MEVVEKNKKCCSRLKGYGPLVIRVTLGAFFLMAGVMKLADPNGFVETVKSMNVLPESLSVAWGYALPYLEILVGAAAIVGFMTRWAGLAMALLLLSFMIALGFMPEGRPNPNIVFMASALSLYFTGSKKWALSSMMNKKCKGGDCCKK